jgi:hypothetical protein
MKAKQLAEEVYEKLVSLDYARKANDFTESGDTYFDNLFQEVQDAIRSFPISYVDHREDLMDIDNLDGEQQFYVFQNDLGFYLVDTQGYNYPRYITELHNFEIDEDDSQDDSMEMMGGLIRIADGQIFDSVVRSLVVELTNEGFHKSDIQKFLLHKLDTAIEKVL